MSRQPCRQHEPVGVTRSVYMYIIVIMGNVTNIILAISVIKNTLLAGCYA